MLPTKEVLTRAVNAGDLRASAGIPILASSGLRVSALINLRLGDISMEKSPALVRVRGTIIEAGKVKGAKERESRTTFVTGEAKESLKLYLDKRRQAGEKTGPGSTVMVTEQGRAMSKRNLSVILRNAFDVAGATKQDEGCAARRDLALSPWRRGSGKMV